MDQSRFNRKRIIILRDKGVLMLFYCVLLVLISCNGKQEKSEDVSTKNMTNTDANKSEQKMDEKFILFFGNSLTAGYGLENEADAFPAVIQRRLDEIGSEFIVVNAGLSGETTAGGLGRIDWVLKQPVDLFFLELGANDALRGLNVEETEINLRGIIEKVRTKYPDIPIIIAGMQSPPNMGAAYAKRFNSIFSSLAEEYNAGLIPFILENVATIDSLNQRDGIHPNVKGAQILADNVWQVMERYVK